VDMAMGQGCLNSTMLAMFKHHVILTLEDIYDY